MLARIEDRPVVMKGLVAGGDGGLRRDHSHAHVVQDGPQMVEPSDPTQPAGAGGEDPRGLASPRDHAGIFRELRIGPTGPIDGILEHRGHRTVVLRARDDYAVAQFQGFAEASDPVWHSLYGLGIAVIERNGQISKIQVLDLYIDRFGRFGPSQCDMEQFPIE